MQHEFFRGQDMREAMGKVRASMGEDAMVLFSRSIDDGNGVSAEIAAAPAAVVDAFRLGLEWGSPEIKRPDPARLGPRFIALVGPPGAGKTLTGVKLALSEHAFAGNGVGFLTLDTYRVGAVDELQTYAELMGVPVEVVYSRREVEGAIQRLRHCQTVIVDTPGRTPDAIGRFGPWEQLLRLINPHEVHLVLPASIRLDVAAHYRASLKELGVTHFLPSKLDHVPGDAGLAELVESVGLPSRWVADGHEVPGNLRPAGPRILTALGRMASAGFDGVEKRAVS